MKTVLRLFAFLLLALLAAGARADNTAAADYILGPDDVLDITVRNHPDLNKIVTILPDGKIGFPDVGDVQAAGKTPKALAADIQRELEKTRNRVEVVISVKEVHSQKVRIVGAVKTSNVFDLKRGWRLMDLIAVAGGLNVKPTRVVGRIVRGNAKVITLDIPAAVARPDSDANPALENDDLVVLDEVDITKQVHVLGEVVKPGASDLAENTTIISLLSEAGGPTEKAAMNKAYVLRGSTHIPMSLLKVMVKNESDANVTGFKLQSGDVLFVPEVDERFAVLGQVNKPGYYPVSEREEMTVLKALSLAGGPTTEAELRSANILRIVNGKAVARPINIDAMLKKGKLTENVALKADEVLVIPSRSRKLLSLGDFLGPISTLLSFGLLR